MKPGRVTFIADASDNIGMGHVYRCSTLADALIDKGWNVSFLAKQGLSAAILPEGKEIKVHYVPDFDDAKYEQRVTDVLKREQIDVVILDLWEHHQALHSFLATDLELGIVTLTMFNYEIPRFEDASVYIGMESLGYDEIEGTGGKLVKIYSGSDYIIIRKEFERSFQKTFRDSDNRILVTMGGADPEHFTEKVIEAIELIEFPVDCDVIVGKLNVNKKKILNRHVQLKQNIRFHEHVEDFASLMSAADIAVINGGMTRYELGVLGTPYIAISIHERQQGITERMTSLGGGINLGIGNNLTPDNVSSAIQGLIKDVDLRRGMSSKMKTICDTRGVFRIIKIIEKIYEKYNLELDKN